MDVGDEGRQQHLVPENPDQHGDIDDEHHASGVLPGFLFICPAKRTQ